MAIYEFSQPGFWVVTTVLGCAAIYSSIFIFYLTRITGILVTLLVRFFILDTNASFSVKSVLFSPLKCQLFFKGLFFQNEDLSISLEEAGLAFPILYSNPKYYRLREDMLSNNLLDSPCLVDSRLSKCQKGIIKKVDLVKKKLYIDIVDSDEEIENMVSSNFARSSPGDPYCSSCTTQVKKKKKKRWKIASSAPFWDSDLPLRRRFNGSSTEDEEEEEEEEMNDAADTRSCRTEGKATGRRGSSVREVPILASNTFSNRGKGERRAEQEHEEEEDEMISLRASSAHRHSINTSYTSSMISDTRQTFSNPSRSPSIRIKKGDSVSTVKDISKTFFRESKSEGKADFWPRSANVENSGTEGFMDGSPKVNLGFSVDAKEKRGIKVNSNTYGKHSSDYVRCDSGVFTYPTAHGVSSTPREHPPPKPAGIKESRKKWHNYESILLPQTYSRCRFFVSGFQLSVYNATGKYEELAGAASEIVEAEQYFQNADARKRQEWCSSPQTATSEEENKKGMRHAKKLLAGVARYVLFSRNQKSDWTKENVAKYVQRQQRVTKTLLQRFFEFVRAVEVDVHNVSCSVGGASQKEFPFFLHLSTKRLSGMCYHTREGMASPLDLYRSVYDFSLEEVGVRIAEMSEVEKEIQLDEKLEGTESEEGLRQASGSEGHADGKKSTFAGIHAGKLPADVFSVIVHPREENVIHVRLYLDAPNVYAGEEISADTLPRAGVEISLNIQQIAFGPWAELVRRQLVEFFFPRNYLPLKPLHIQLGDPRPRPPVDVVVTFLQATTLNLMFQRQSITVRPPFGVVTVPDIGVLAVNLGAESEFIYRSGFLLPGKNHQRVKMLFSGKTVKVMVNAVLGLPCTVAELDSVQCYIDRCDPLLWNECKIWDITTIVSRGYCTYSTSYIPFFQDFLTDWEFSESTYLDALCTPQTFNTTKRFVDEFIPQVRKINIFVENMVELRFNLNNQNVIYGRDPFSRRENALAIMRVLSAHVEVDLSSDQYVLRSRNEVTRPIHVTTEKISVLFQLPPSHPCHNTLTEELPFLSMEHVQIKATYTVQTVNQAKPKTVKKLMADPDALNNHLELSITLSRVRGDFRGTHIKAIYLFLDNYFIDHTASITPKELFWLFPIIQRKEGFGKNTKKEWLTYWASSYIPGNFLELQVTVKITDIEATVAPLHSPHNNPQGITTEEWWGEMHDTNRYQGKRDSPRELLWKSTPYVLLLRCPDYVFTFTKTVGVTEFNITIQSIVLRWLQNNIPMQEEESAPLSARERPSPESWEKGEAKERHGEREVVKRFVPSAASMSSSSHPIHQEIEEKSVFLCIGNIIVTMINHYGQLPLRSVIQKNLQVNVSGIRFDVTAIHLYHVVSILKSLQYEVFSCEDRLLEEAIVKARQDAEKYVMQHKMELDGESGEESDLSNTSASSSYQLFVPPFNRKPSTKAQQGLNLRNRQDRTDRKELSSKSRSYGRQILEHKLPNNSSRVKLFSSRNSLSISTPFSPLVGKSHPQKVQKQLRMKLYLQHQGRAKEGQKREWRMQQDSEEMSSSVMDNSVGDGMLTRMNSTSLSSERPIAFQGSEEWIEEKENTFEGKDSVRHRMEKKQDTKMDVVKSASLFHLQEEHAQDANVLSSIPQHIRKFAKEHKKVKKEKKMNNCETFMNALTASFNRSSESSDSDPSASSNSSESTSLIPPSLHDLNRSYPPPPPPSPLHHRYHDPLYIPIISPFLSQSEPYNVPSHLAKRFADFLAKTEEEEQRFKMFGLTFLHASVTEISGVIRLGGEEEGKGKTGVGSSSTRANEPHTSPTPRSVSQGPSSPASFSSSDLFWLYLPQGVYAKSSSLQTLASMKQMMLHLPSIQLHGMRSAAMVCPTSVLEDYNRSYRHRHGPARFFAASRSPENQQKDTRGRTDRHVAKTIHFVSDASPPPSGYTPSTTSLASGAVRPVMGHASTARTVSPASSHGFILSPSETSSASSTSFSSDSTSSGVATRQPASQQSSSLFATAPSPYSPEISNMMMHGGGGRPSGGDDTFTTPHQYLRSSTNSVGEDYTGHPSMTAPMEQGMGRGREKKGQKERPRGGGNSQETLTDEDVEGEEGSSHSFSVPKRQKGRVVKPAMRELLVRVFYFSSGCTFVHHTKVSGRDVQIGEHVEMQRKWFRDNNVHGLLHEWFLAGHGFWTDMETLGGGSPFDGYDAMNGQGTVSTAHTGSRSRTSPPSASRPPPFPRNVPPFNDTVPLPSSTEKAVEEGPGGAHKSPPSTAPSEPSTVGGALLLPPLSSEMSSLLSPEWEKKRKADASDPLVDGAAPLNSPSERSTTTNDGKVGPVEGKASIRRGRGLDLVPSTSEGVDAIPLSPSTSSTHVTPSSILQLPSKMNPSGKQDAPGMRKKNNDRLAGPDTSVSFQSPPPSQVSDAVFHPDTGRPSLRLASPSPLKEYHEGTREDNTDKGATFSPASLTPSTSPTVRFTLPAPSSQSYSSSTSEQDAKQEHKDGNNMEGHGMATEWEKGRSYPRSIRRRSMSDDRGTDSSSIHSNPSTFSPSSEIESDHFHSLRSKTEGSTLQDITTSHRFLSCQSCSSLASEVDSDELQDLSARVEELPDDYPMPKERVPTTPTDDGVDPKQGSRTTRTKPLAIQEKDTISKASPHTGHMLSLPRPRAETSSPPLLDETSRHRYSSRSLSAMASPKRRKRSMHALEPARGGRPSPDTQSGKDRFFPSPSGFLPSSSTESSYSSSSLFSSFSSDAEESEHEDSLHGTFQRRGDAIPFSMQRNQKGRHSEEMPHLFSYAEDGGRHGERDSRRMEAGEEDRKGRDGYARTGAPPFHPTCAAHVMERKPMSQAWEFYSFFQQAPLSSTTLYAAPRIPTAGTGYAFPHSTASTYTNVADGVHSNGSADVASVATSSLNFKPTISVLAYNPHRLASDGSADRTGCSAPLPNVFFACVLPSISSEEPYIRESSSSQECGNVSTWKESSMYQEGGIPGETNMESEGGDGEKKGAETPIAKNPMQMANFSGYQDEKYLHRRRLFMMGEEDEVGTAYVAQQHPFSPPRKPSNPSEQDFSTAYVKRVSIASNSSLQHLRGTNAGPGVGTHFSTDLGANRMDVLSSAWKSSRSSVLQDQHLIREHISVEFQPESILHLSLEMCSMAGPIMGFARSCMDALSYSSANAGGVMIPSATVQNSAPMANRLGGAWRMNGRMNQAVKYSARQVVGPSHKTPGGKNTFLSHLHLGNTMRGLNSLSSTGSVPKKKFNKQNELVHERNTKSPQTPSPRDSSPGAFFSSTLSAERFFAFETPKNHISRKDYEGQPSTFQSSMLTLGRSKKAAQVFYRMRKPLKVYVVNGKIPKFQVSIFGRAILKKDSLEINEVMKMMLNGGVRNENEEAGNKGGNDGYRSPTSADVFSFPTSAAGTTHGTRARRGEEDEQKNASTTTMSLSSNALASHMEEPSIVRLSIGIYGLNMFFQKKPKPRRSNRHALVAHKEVLASAEAAATLFPPESQTFSLMIRHSDVLTVCSINEHCRWKEPLAVDVPHFVRTATVPRDCDVCMKNVTPGSGKSRMQTLSSLPSSLSSRCVVGVVYAGEGSSVVCVNAVPFRVAVSPLSLGIIKGHFTRDLGYVVALAGSMIKEIKESKIEIIPRSKKVVPSSPIPGYSSNAVETSLEPQYRRPQNRGRVPPLRTLRDEEPFEEYEDGVYTEESEETRTASFPFTMTSRGMVTTSAAVYMTDAPASAMEDGKYRDSHLVVPFLPDEREEEWGRDEEYSSNDVSSTSSDTQTDELLIQQRAKTKGIQVEAKVNLQCIYIELYNVIPDSDVIVGHSTTGGGRSGHSHHRHHAGWRFPKAFVLQHAGVSPFYHPHPHELEEKHHKVPRRIAQAQQRWVIADEPNSCAIGPCFIHVSAKREKQWEYSKATVNAASHLSSFQLQVYPNLLLNLVHILLPSLVLNPMPNASSFGVNSGGQHARSAGTPSTHPRSDTSPTNERTPPRPSASLFSGRRNSVKSPSSAMGSAGSHATRANLLFPFFSLRSSSSSPSDAGSTSLPGRAESMSVGKAAGFFSSLPHDSVEMKLCCRLGKLEMSVLHSKDNFFRFAVQDIVLSHSTAPQSSRSNHSPEDTPFIDITKLSVFIKTRLWYLGVKAKLKFLNQSVVAPSMLSTEPHFNSTSSLMLHSMAWSYHPDTSIDGKSLHSLLHSIFISENKKLGEMNLVLEKAYVVTHHCAVSAVRCRQQHISVQLSGIRVELPHIPHFMDIIYPQLQHLAFAWRYSFFSAAKYLKEHVSTSVGSSASSLSTPTSSTSSPFSLLASQLTTRRQVNKGREAPSILISHYSQGDNSGGKTKPSSTRKSRIPATDYKRNTESPSQKKPALLYPWRDEIPSLTDHHEFRAAGAGYSFWVMVRVQDIRLSLGLDMNLVQEYTLPKLLCFAESSDHRWKVKTQIFSCVVSSFQSFSSSFSDEYKKENEMHMERGASARRKGTYDRRKHQHDVGSAQLTLPRIFFDFSGDEKKLNCIGVVESLRANITTVLLKHIKLAVEKMQKELLPLLRPIPLPQSRDGSFAFLFSGGAAKEGSNQTSFGVSTTSSYPQNSGNPYKLIALQKQLYRKRTFAILFCGGRTSCGTNVGVLRCSINYLSLFGWETRQSHQREIKWTFNLDKGEIALTDRVNSLAYSERKNRQKTQQAYYIPTATTSNMEYEQENEIRAVDPSVLSWVNHPSSFRDGTTLGVTPRKTSRKDVNPGSDVSVEQLHAQRTIPIWNKLAFHPALSGAHYSSHDGPHQGILSEMGENRSRSIGTPNEVEDSISKGVNDRKRGKNGLPDSFYRNFQKKSSQRVMIKDHTEVNGFVWGSFSFSGKVKCEKHVEYKIRELPDNANLRASLLNRFKESIIRSEASVFSPVCILRIGGPVVATQYFDEIKETLDALSELSMRKSRKSLGALQFEEKFKELNENKIKILKVIEQNEIEQKRKFDLLEKEIAKELMMKEGIVNTRSVSLQRTFVATVYQAGLVIPLGDCAYHQVVAYVDDIASRSSPSAVPSSPGLSSGTIRKNVFKTKDFVPHFAFKLEIDRLGAQVRSKEQVQVLLGSEVNDLDNVSPMLHAVGYLHANSLKAFFTDGTSLLSSSPSVYSTAIFRSTIFGGKGILSLSNRKEEFYQSRNTLVIPSILMPLHLEKQSEEKVSKWRIVVDISSPILRASPWIYVICAELRNELGYTSSTLPTKRSDKKCEQVAPITIEEQSLAVLHRLKNTGTRRLSISTFMLNTKKIRKETMRRRSKLFSISSASLFPKSDTRRKESLKEVARHVELRKNPHSPLSYRALRRYGGKGRKFSSSSRVGAFSPKKHRTPTSTDSSMEDREEIEHSFTEKGNGAYETEVKEKQERLHVDVSARLERGKLYIFSHTYSEESAEMAKRQKNFELSREDGMGRSSSGGHTRRSAGVGTGKKVDKLFSFSSLTSFRASSFTPGGERDNESNAPLPSDATDSNSFDGTQGECLYCMDYEAENMSYLSFFYLPSAVVHGCWRKGREEQHRKSFTGNGKQWRGSPSPVGDHCIFRAEVDLNEVRLSPPLFMITEEMKLVRNIFQQLKSRRPDDVIRRIEALGVGASSRRFFRYLHCSPVELFMPIPHGYTHATIARWKKEVTTGVLYINSNAFSNYNRGSFSAEHHKAPSTGRSSTSSDSTPHSEQDRTGTRAKKPFIPVSSYPLRATEDSGTLSLSHMDSARAASFQTNTTSIHVSMRHFNFSLDTSPIHSTSFSCFLGEEGSIDFLLQFYNHSKQKRKEARMVSGKNLPDHSITLHVNQLRAECQTRLEVKSLEVYVPEITVAISQSMNLSTEKPSTAEAQTRTISLNFPFKGEFSQQNALIRLQHFSQVFLVHEVWSPTLRLFARSVGEFFPPTQILFFRMEMDSSVSQDGLPLSATGHTEGSSGTQYSSKNAHAGAWENLKLVKTEPRHGIQKKENQREYNGEKDENTSGTKAVKENLCLVASVSGGWFELDMGGGNVQHLNSGSLNFGFQRTIRPRSSTLIRAKLRLKDVYMKSDGILSGSLRISNVMLLVYRLNNASENVEFSRTNEGRTSRFHMQIDGLLCSYKERHIKEVLDWKAESFVLNGMDGLNVAKDSNLFHLTTEVNRSKLRLTPSTMPAILNFLYSLNVILRNRKGTTNEKIQSALQGKNIPSYILKTLLPPQPLQPSQPQEPLPSIVMLRNLKGPINMEDEKKKEGETTIRQKREILNSVGFPDDNQASSRSASSFPLLALQSKKVSENGETTLSNDGERKGTNKRRSVSAHSPLKVRSPVQRFIRYMGGEYEKIPCGQVRLSITNAAITFGDVDDPKSLNMVVVQVPFALVSFAECLSDNNTVVKRFLQFHTEAVEFFRPTPKKSLIMGLKGKNILDFYTSQKLGSREVGFTLDLSQEHPWTGNPLYRDFSEVLELVNQFINNSNVQILKKMMTGNFEDESSSDSKHRIIPFSTAPVSLSSSYQGDGNYSEFSPTDSRSAVFLNSKPEVSIKTSPTGTSQVMLSQKIAEKAELLRVQDPRTFKPLRPTKFSPQVRFGGDVSVNTEVILNWLGVTEKVLPRAIHCSICDKFEKVLDKGMKITTDKGWDSDLVPTAEKQRTRKQ